MAETSEIARIAEKISDEIFAQFHWTKIGPMNHNWKCENDKHEKETHPTDVVFCYPEPFRDTVTYVQCDLKSYAAASISVTAVKKALVSLSQQVSCAEISEHWQNTYTNQVGAFDIAGLLFVYNHDGGYDREFNDTLENVAFERLDTPPSGKLFVQGPADIYWLNNVASDIMRLRGNGKLPPLPQCSYFYPQPVRFAQIRGSQRCAATLEMLSGPWIILKFDDNTRKLAGMMIFYRASGETVEEFLYLLDFLRQHDCYEHAFAIEIRTLDFSKSSMQNFQKAKQNYVMLFSGTTNPDGLGDQINAVRLTVISQTVPTFSEIELGMDYA